MHKCVFKIGDVIILTGLARNTAKLFSNDGKLFIVALDHPQFFGPMEGLERPLEILERLEIGRAHV